MSTSRLSLVSRSEPQARRDTAIHRIREAIAYRRSIGDKMARVKLDDLEIILNAIGARL